MVLAAGQYGVLLANELFWITHRDLTGQPRLHPKAMGLGLAAGLLGELVLAEHLFLAGRTLTVMDPRSPADVLAHSTLDQIVAESGVRDLRAWLAFLARDAEDAVGQRLWRDGLVDRQVHRWRRPSVRYLPRDKLAGARPLTRLYIGLTRDEPLSVLDTTLAGLVAALGLTRTVLFDAGPSGDSVRRLHARVVALPQPLRDLVVQTEAAVGDLVLSHRA